MVWQKVNLASSLMISFFLATHQDLKIPNSIQTWLHKWRGTFHSEGTYAPKFTEIVLIYLRLLAHYLDNRLTWKGHTAGKHEQITLKTKDLNWFVSEVHIFVLEVYLRLQSVPKYRNKWLVSLFIDKDRHKQEKLQKEIKSIIKTGLLKMFPIIFVYEDGTRWRTRLKLHCQSIYHFILLH